LLSSIVEAMKIQRTMFASVLVRAKEKRFLYCLLAIFLCASCRTAETHVAVESIPRSTIQNPQKEYDKDTKYLESLQGEGDWRKLQALLDDRFKGGDGLKKHAHLLSRADYITYNPLYDSFSFFFQLGAKETPEGIYRFTAVVRIDTNKKIEGAVVTRMRIPARDT
jgi:hypothetical protein